MNNYQAEFYECNCHDRDHLIIIHKDYFQYSLKNNKPIVDINLYLEFIATKGDCEASKVSGYKIMNFFRRKWWRVKEAFKIIFLGYYKVDDVWVPLTLEEELGLVGIKETKRLGEMLIKFANDAEDFYKKRDNND